MLFSDIKPFVRFARFLKLTNKTKFSPATPYDARLFYTKEGAGVIEVMGQKFEMKKGSALLINSAVPYHTKTPKTSVTYLAFNFDYMQSANENALPVVPAWGDSFDEKKLTEHIEFSDKKQFNDFVYVPAINSIEYIAEEIIKEYAKKLINYELKSAYLLSEILVEIARHSEIPATQDTTATKMVLDYIEKNYASQITNLTLATKFGFHPNYLSSLIKASTGLPMHQYLLQIRLAHAIELLEINSFSITEIAEQCGFCDVYHFSRYFKSVMKITPSQFAKGTKQT